MSSVVRGVASQRRDGRVTGQDPMLYHAVMGALQHGTELLQQWWQPKREGRCAMEYGNV